MHGVLNQASGPVPGEPSGQPVRAAASTPPQSPAAPSLGARPALHPAHSRPQSGAAALGRGEALALAFAMLFPTLAIWLYFYAAADPALSRLAYGAAKAVQFAFPLAWALLAEHGALGFGPGQPETRRGWGLAAGLGTGLLAFAGIAAGYPLLLAGRAALAGAPQGIGDKLALFGVDGPGSFLLFAGFYSLLHSFLEEYYWRWFVFGRLRRRLSPVAAGVLSSLAFTSHHVLLLGVLLGGFGPATWLLATGVTAGGAVWAWLFHRSGSLLGPWASHALADAGLMWIGYQFWRG